VREHTEEKWRTERENRGIEGENGEEKGEKGEERKKFRENKRKGRKKKLYITGQNKLKYWLKDEQ
jgi:hypothetical protein